MMFKQILLLVGLSVAAIFFQSQLTHVLHSIMYIHNQIAKGLGVIFAVDTVGEVVQSVLSLLLIPVVLGILLGIAHFFIKQAHFPHTLTVIWVSWAVLLASILSQSGHVTNQVANMTPQIPSSNAIASSAKKMNQTQGGQQDMQQMAQGSQQAQQAMQQTGEHQS